MAVGVPMLMPLAAETTFVTLELYLAIALGSVKHRDNS
jgi:hypothetical protein